MKNAFEENYVFYRLVSTDLDEAYRSLHDIRRYKRGSIVMVLIKNAVISYARPFMQCKGKYRNDYRLCEKRFVPPKYRKLHKKILNYRNQVFAHTDIGVREPGLGKLNLGTAMLYPIRLKGKGFYYEDYLTLVDEMKELILTVKDAVLIEINEYQKKLR